jgi:hypothetical protein
VRKSIKIDEGKLKLHVNSPILLKDDEDKYNLYNKTIIRVTEERNRILEEIKREEIKRADIKLKEFNDNLDNLVDNTVSLFIPTITNIYKNHKDQLMNILNSNVNINDIINNKSKPIDKNYKHYIIVIHNVLEV